jgi:GNAT superfamily N-acetyltransferase
MEEVYGRFNERWLEFDEGSGEKCFVSEFEGRIVGTAWVTVVGSRARFHSVSVSPRYRRLGIGSDLWEARRVWAQRSGVQRALAEIASKNLPSQAVAMRGGMRRMGETYLYQRPRAPTDGG